MWRSAVALMFVSTIIFSAPGGAVGRLPFESSFETGDFSEWDGGADASLIVADDAASDGRYSARAEMVPGASTDNYKEFYFGDHRTVNGAPADDDLWLEFDSRFDNGFDFGSGGHHKVAILNFTNANGRRIYQVIINVDLPQEAYVIENLRWQETGGFDGTVAWQEQNVGGAPTAIRRGEWDQVKLFMKLNTPGQRNGIIRMWINGVLKMEYLDAYMRENTNFNPNKLILSNYVTETNRRGYQRWDNFYLGDAERNAGTLAPPNPPTVHQ